MDPTPVMGTEIGIEAITVPTALVLDTPVRLTVTLTGPIGAASCFSVAKGALAKGEKPNIYFTFYTVVTLPRLSDKATFVLGKDLPSPQSIRTTPWPPSPPVPE